MIYGTNWKRWPVNKPCPSHHVKKEESVPRDTVKDILKIAFKIVMLIPRGQFANGYVCLFYVLCGKIWPSKSLDETLLPPTLEHDSVRVSRDGEILHINIDTAH